MLKYGDFTFSLNIVVMHKPRWIVGLAFFISSCGLAQLGKPNPDRLIQVSLVPGLGTNGFHPGTYNNFFSLNLTAGLSNSNRIFEVGVFSNLNVSETRGFQLAGVANLTGANAFANLMPKEVDKKVNGGFEANLHGWQISGLTNVVLNNVFGVQWTAGVNHTHGALFGWQLAGLGNTVHKYSFGVQVAGLWNTSRGSMDGVQLGTLLNFTEGGLFGFQVGAFNHAGFSQGVHSVDASGAWGIQIGLFNRAARMNGFQFGLINIAGPSQGTQVGLINIYRRGQNANTKDGTAIGLLNIGELRYVAVYADELFITNYEVATGNRKNGRITTASVLKAVENSLIYSRSSWHSADTWAVGYGLRKSFWNRSAGPGRTEYRFFGLGLEVLQVNTERRKFLRDWNLITRGKLQAGTRIHPKLYGVYAFGSVTLNYANRLQGINASRFDETADARVFWPGFSAGFLLH
jgi:hypothetical protein